VGGVAQGDCAARRPGRDAVQPSIGGICRILAEALRSSRCRIRRAGDISSSSQQSELASVIAEQAREPNSGLIVMPDSFLIAHRAETTSLAAQYRLPAVYPYRLFAEAGGLLSYGIDQTDNFRRAAIYVDRILKGEKPGELPIQAPVKFELVVNLKTAKALGLTIPGTFLQRADEVIE
jgi:putative ABC transport system substrate-binding protein